MTVSHKNLSNYIQLLLVKLDAEPDIATTNLMSQTDPKNMAENRSKGNYR